MLCARKAVRGPPRPGARCLHRSVRAYSLFASWTPSESPVGNGIRYYTNPAFSGMIASNAWKLAVGDAMRSALTYVLDDS